MVKLTFASAFFFLVAFFTLAVASPTETRTTDDIIQTIGKASTDLNNLTMSLKSIKNGLSASKAIVSGPSFFLFLQKSCIDIGQIQGHQHRIQKSPKGSEPIGPRCQRK
jgi:hypothetical protein